MNIAERLSDMARRYPTLPAVIEPMKSKTPDGHRKYKTVTFDELEEDSNRIAAALLAQGVRPGMRIALFVHYGFDFISLVFALCKAGVVLVLIDPGMGIRRMLDCLTEVEPDGFVAVPAVHLGRILMRNRFPQAKHNLTVGRAWLPFSLTLDKIRRRGIPDDFETARTDPNDPVAIIFTSGSTGPPKGVLFTHGMFDTQVEQISKRYSIFPGGIDLACFPFFGLFDAAMGVTAVIPEMDPTRPAQADPKKIVDAANRWEITQSFASPALWNRVADYCKKTGTKIPTLEKAISAGAPVSAEILRKLKPWIAAKGDIYTPYGATEALPVASIAASEILEETVFRTEKGSGVCVGKKADSIQWHVIEISDFEIPDLDYAQILPTGEIGELIVTGPQVTREYVNRPEANALAKIVDSDGQVWHRMGDLGYLDQQDRFWFCGRKAHRVETQAGTLFTIPCEAIFNCHEAIFRSALVPTCDGKNARVFVQPYPEKFPHSKQEEDRLIDELKQLAAANPVTESIKIVRVLKDFPVDVRHNVKINRELMATYPD